MMNQLNRAALLALAVILTPMLAMRASADGFGPLPLWAKGAPGAIGTEEKDIPTLESFLPEKGKGTGGAVIVCPGGGYAGLAPHEAAPIAEWLRSAGIAGFVLRYRHAPRYKEPTPLLDAQRAIRTVRAKAAEFGIDPNHIGILGFSAGGHLTTTAGTHFDDGDPKAEDPIDRVSCRPDAMIPVYPVVSMTDIGHAGSRRNLLGENPSPELVNKYCNELQVTEKTPPTFLVHGADDKAVPVENSLLFASALRKAGVPFELHVFEQGEHGFGLGQKDPILAVWPEMAAKWLHKQGF